MSEQNGHAGETVDFKLLNSVDNLKDFVFKEEDYDVSDEGESENDVKPDNPDASFSLSKLLGRADGSDDKKKRKISRKYDKTYKRDYQEEELESKMQIDQKLESPDYLYRYNMSHPKRGLFLLFNQATFTNGMPARYGTDVDAQNLVDLFTTLKFDVKTYVNKSKAQFLGILHEAAQYDHTNVDCFACAILTHGDQKNNEDLLYLRDDYVFNKDVFALFRGDKCPKLAGKPKFFVIQACRGNNLDAACDAVDAPQFMDVSYGQERKYRVPVEADFLYAYSTTPRYYSWRNPTHGSWFIQDLVKVFKEQHNNLDVLTMLTRVSGNVALNRESNADGIMNKKRQIPCVVSQLTKDFYLSTQ